MTQDDGGYDIKPTEKPPAPEPATDFVLPASSSSPKPGEPGWAPPVPRIERANGTEETSVDPDIEKNKGMAILAYICFIIPLLAAPKSSFARFHANQGLLTFIAWCAAIIGVVILALVHTLLSYVKIEILANFFGCIIFLLQPALLVGALALTIYGIIQAANGEKKGLPLFGQIVLIK